MVNNHNNEWIGKSILNTRTMCSMETLRGDSPFWTNLIIGIIISNDVVPTSCRICYIRHTLSPSLCDKKKTKSQPKMYPQKEHFTRVQ